MSFSRIYREISNKGVLYAWFSAMHTRVDLMICGESEEKLIQLAGNIKSELDRLESIANYYDPKSELFRVNRDASHVPVPVSRDLYAMVKICLDANARTFGYFDVSIQSEGYDGMNLQAVQLDAETMSISYRKPGIKIDLSGFLKGYALDEIKRMIASHHIQDALINLGNSSILAMGNHPNGEGWKVAPDIQFASQGNEILLMNQCLTVSGNDTASRKHIVSPQTGRLIEGEKRIAVITDSGVQGEVLSTGLFAASPEDRERLITNFNVKIILF